MANDLDLKVKDMVQKTFITLFITRRQVLFYRNATIEIGLEGKLKKVINARNLPSKNRYLNAVI